MGYGDVGFNRATGPATPNLDRLAREGTRFTTYDTHVAAIKANQRPNPKKRPR